MAAIGHQLHLKQEQRLVMTPQLQMAIKLLQMPALDLQEFIDREMLDNPFLVADDGSTEGVVATNGDDHAEIDSATALSGEGVGTDGDIGLDAGWDNMYDSGTSGATGSVSSAAGEDDDFGWEQTASADISLKEHLEQQLGVATDDRTQRFIGSYLIDAIDDAGYLRTDVSSTATLLQVDEKKVEEVLYLIQSFEPAGVGARGLEECLSLQLAQKIGLSKRVLEISTIVLENLELLARHDIGKLARLSKCTTDEMMDVVETIKSLTPKPGLEYGSDVLTAIIPDVTVMKSDGKWKAELNVDAMPRLLVQEGFSLHAKSSADEKSYVNERMNRAQWLLKSLEQRAKTIYKVANVIVTMQSDFFDYGAESLQPMTLKNVAEIVEAHESTVSRVTNGKYMQTPMGIFEMKYFFSSAINTTGGTVSVASQSVRQMIKRLIAEEDTTKPVSDEKLVELLKREGIDVARRTVAKYREGLGIPSSSKRRVRL